MQAIELSNNYDSWFTLVILFTIVLIAVLKLIKPNQLLGYTIAFFTPGFFQKKAEEYITIFKPFTFVLALFSIVILALIFQFTLAVSIFNADNFNTFLKILAFIFCYFFVRYFLDLFLANVLAIKENVNYFLHVKYGYLFTICLLMLPFIILNKYTIRSKFFILSIFILLLIIRAFFILFNNKRIVISKLFYFILYFCTLEIAPLLILYKTTTT
ncbi:DUF4271 domain-containing protein [Tenacibaculum sp. TC6]|uniref:DUF4271 domain-containing protein n=1 Tax=Tenacibaculum sp. TC6 TaxID=3423223 RepID=UPI003D35ED8F